MNDEQHRVQPLLERLAMFGVHELVLGNEQARRGGRQHVPNEVARPGLQTERQRVADEHAQRIDGVPDPLPAW
jgi:hypothetical protein